MAGWFSDQDIVLHLGDPVQEDRPDQARIVHSLKGISQP